ncbi:MAG: peroxiredoxin [Planctomycetota bacterium]
MPTTFLLLTCAFIVGAFVLGMQGADAGGDGERKPLAVGDTAPAWRLNDDAGRAVSLADAKGKAWVVLAFYPKASTSGCTKEMCSLRDALADLEGLDARVYGISIDDVVDQRAFKEAQSLTFPLLSDPDGGVARKYQVLPAGAAYTQRVTFITDPEGVLRAIDREVGVTSHGRDLAARLRQLQAK